MEKKKKPIFEKRIFWDVNFEQIDYDAKANFVIERVFERGDVEDIRQCRRYYGDEKVTEALLKAKFLPEHTIYFASAIIDKPIELFRCYTLRQLNPDFFRTKRLNCTSGTSKLFIGWRYCSFIALWPPQFNRY